MKTMPHLHDDEHLATSSESEVVSTSSRENKQQDHQHQVEEDGNGLTTTNETKAVDRLLSLAATASRHAPPRETEPSNESPNVGGTKAAGVGNHPAVTPSPLNALHRPAHQHQQQQWMGTNQLQPGLPHSFHYNGPMYSVYQGTKPIVSSPIRCRSPATSNNDRDEEHLATTTPKKLVVQKAKREHAEEEEDDRCASPPRTRKVTVLDPFHRFLPSHNHHHQYHHNMVPLHGSMILPQSPIHHQRQRNGQATNAAGTAVATPPFHWSAYPPQHHAYHPYMTGSFAPTTMHPDGSGSETPHRSNKRPVPAEEREDVPNAKRRLSLPVHESTRTVSGDSHQTSSREESSTSDDPKKFETSVSKKDNANEDGRRAESLASNRVEPKDEKQRVISPSSSNDGASKGEDDEFSSSTASGIPPKVEFGTRGGTTKGGATVPQANYPPPMMPHAVHHARNLRGAHAMYSPFHHHHPAMHMGYPPAGYGPPPPQPFEMHPGPGWYSAMGPPSGPSPPFPYTVMSQMGSNQHSSQHTSRPSSPTFPARTMFPHRSPPLSPLRSPNRDVEEVTPTTSSRAVDRKETKNTAANPQPLSCSSQASTPSSMEPPATIAATATSQPIKSVADWQKATIATGMAPSANRCVPLKAPIPTKYWGESNTAKDVPLPDFHRLVNFPDYLTKTRPNQADGGVVAASKANGQRHCVMCGSLRLCSAATSQLASSQRSNRKKGADAGDDDEDGASQKKGGAVTSTTTHIIPRQNKGLCTACDVTVWVVTETGMEIKWCKGCKNFRPWVAFGDKGLATKCVRCRDRQREKYALQKEESGRCGRRPSQSLLVRRRSSSTPQPPQLAAVAATTNQEDGDNNSNNEDAEHVAAARGLRNLMAASI